MLRALSARASTRQAFDAPRRRLPYAALLPLCGLLWLGCAGNDGAPDADGTTDAEATDTGAVDGQMTATPMMLSLAVGASADVVVAGTTAAFPLGPDDAEFLMSWTAMGSVSVVHAGGIAQGDLVPARDAEYSETFTITCDVEAPGTATFDLQGLGDVLTMATVTVLCGEDSGTTTATAPTTGSTSPDPDGTSGTGDPPGDAHSLYCFDEFGAGLARVTLGETPTLDFADFVGHVPVGAVFGDDPLVFVGGLFPEGGDPVLVRYDDWAIDDAPDAEIPHPAPNLFADACPSSAGVLFTGETTDSMVCDFAVGSCTEVTSPSPLNACSCAGSDCVAGPLLDGNGMYISTDGGLTFTAHPEVHEPDFILGDGNGVMAYHGVFDAGTRVSQNAGANFVPAVFPAGLDAAQPLIVTPDRIIAGVPFMGGNLAESVDGGERWYAEPFSDADYPQQIVSTTEGNLAAVSQAGTFYLRIAPFDGPWEEVPDLSLPITGRCYGG